MGMLAKVIPLTAQTPDAGCLSVVTGSHKSNLRYPQKITDIEIGATPWIETLDISPGTAVLFPEATAHAVAPWVAEWERRAILLKVYPAHLRAFGAPLRPSSEPFWAPACTALP